MHRRDWSSLPVEILQLISDHLQTNFVDSYRLQSVCKSWGRIIQSKKPRNPPPQQLPWLLLPSLHDNRCRFYSISDKRPYHLPPSAFFNQTSCSRRSSLGWLLMIEESTLNTFLFNPLTETRVSLPSVRTVFNVAQSLQVRVIGKIVLSGNPKDGKQEVTVVMSYGLRPGTRFLIYAKLRDNAWKQVRHADFTIEDVVYFNGKFYAVDLNGKVGIYDLGSASSSFERIDIDIPRTFQGDDVYSVVPLMNYLVESAGELLLVRRFQGKKLLRTVMFKVFKEDRISKSWIEVKSLRGHALFLGYNQSLSLLASDYFGCKANCIYFTDNVSGKMFSKKSEPHDVGIFNLESGIIEQLPGYWCDHQFIAQPAVFLVPSPW